MIAFGVIQAARWVLRDAATAANEKPVIAFGVVQTAKWGLRDGATAANDSLWCYSGC